MTIFHWNVQSIGGKIDELELTLNKLGCDICCISEHWKTKDELGVLGIQNYILAASYCREKLEHGGTAIYVLDTLQFKSRPDIEQKSAKYAFELSAIEVMISHVQYVVVTVYRTPSSDANQFFDRCIDLLELSIVEKNKHFIFAGDFNIDLRGDGSEKYKFLDILTSYDYSPTVDEYTRVTKTRKSCLDNVLVRGDLDCSGEVYRTAFSDHFAQVLRIRISREVNLNNYRKYNDHQMESFCEYLAELQWDSLLAEYDVDRKWMIFSDLFSRGFESCFPLHSAPRKTKSLGWMSDELRMLRDRVNIDHF